MLLAAAYGGVAIENSMLGDAHSMANPLTMHHDIAHGQAVGMTLPHIVRFNAEESGAARIYGELARSAWRCAPDADDEEATDALLDRLKALVAAAAFSPSLADYAVPASNAATLADEAAQQWTAQFNPREVSAGDSRQLFETACAASRK